MSTIDISNFPAKAEKRRHRGDPLFAEGVNTRIPIVERGVLRTLNAIRADDSYAASDAEATFASSQVLAAKDVRNLAKPVLSVVEGSVDPLLSASTGHLEVVPAPPVEAPPFTPIAPSVAVAETGNLSNGLTIDDARQMVAASHATDQNSEHYVPNHPRVDQDTLAKVAPINTVPTVTPEATKASTDADLEDWFQAAGWKKDDDPSLSPGAASRAQ